MAASPDRPGAAQWVPARATLSRLRSAVDGCRGCELYADATQGVMGAGPADAPLVVVGEQPGDKEDLAGEPFVGPAGRLLDQPLEAAGLEPKLAAPPEWVVPTVHPSSILRSRQREDDLAAFVADLGLAARRL